MSEFEINIPRRSLPELLGSLKVEYGILKSSLGLINLAKGKLSSDKFNKFLEENETRLRARIDDVTGRISSSKVNDFLSDDVGSYGVWSIEEYVVDDKLRKCVVYSRPGAVVGWTKGDSYVVVHPDCLPEDREYVEKLKNNLFIVPIVRSLIDPPQGLN